ncbi:MAG: hypothetical protein ABIC91_03270 [Nanoarchaeota archaeon]|nr:hypothetical protein [Nanoarchaeota archaeon]MBU1030056.1 hypothetical protein [Nanoarchaeota archaeon]MBU1850459.1 hypothetical protein [Nanoarchaeota archaeon]
MIVQIIGFIGMFLILLCFVMVQIHKWKDTDFKYDFWNLVGALLLVVYAVLIKSYPFLILNAVWVFVSLRDVFSDLENKNQ